nr:immunoglobulin heavy chain junction region [Macaca mulatta]
CARQQNNLDVW